MENETWKDIPGQEGRYQVSDLGRVRRLPYEWKHTYRLRGSGNTVSVTKTAKPSVMRFSDIGGYKRVPLSIGGQKSKQYLVHRLVYCTFHGIPIEFMGQKSRTVVMHRNDDPGDNRLQNLSIGTQMDNMIDMVGKGRKKTVRSESVKIGFSDIPEIRRLRSEGKTIFQIGDTFGVSGATISRALNGKIWVRKG